MPLKVFGVRHLSPAGAFHLRQYLDECKPQAILVEGPSDATDWIQYIVSKKTKPPIALLAYTNEVPVRTILYPFAEYSPEYIALMWGAQKKVHTEFIDLPCSVFLGLMNQKMQERLAQIEAEKAQEDDENQEQEEALTVQAIIEESPEEQKNERDIYERLAQACGYEDYDTYWESEFEHNLNNHAYVESVYEFGLNIRQYGTIDEENLTRESYMRRQIKKLVDSGIPQEKIVVVTGAYHASVLNLDLPPMTDEEFQKLPSLSSTLTLMPYSNLRLSSRTGYGAGNKSPRYFGMMWNAMNLGNFEHLSNRFFIEVARFMRSEGTFKSTAEVIEAARLAKGLAILKGQSQPTLEDLRAAAITCLGHGEVSVVSKALAKIEVGTEMGQLAEGVSRTAIQDDFYRMLSDLNLDKYKTTVAQDLELDLRENRRAKTEKNQWIDLNRSYFLHRLLVLGISFASKRNVSQDNATWKELWILQWTTEAEIELVESSLLGESVEVACAYKMKEQLEQAKTVANITHVIEQATFCGIPSMLELASDSLQAFTIDSDSFIDIAQAAGDLSSAISYGDIRRMDTSHLNPLLSQLFLRAIHIVVDNSKCNQQAAQSMLQSIHIINKISLDHYEFVNESGWIAILKVMADRDDINPSISGYACAILLERNIIKTEDLEIMIARRLSPGIDADLGTGWFEGLAARNRYGLLSRVQVWHMLDKYIATLADEEFTKALVFLRRTFSDFSPQEKRIICTNLGEIWHITDEEAENKLTSELSEDEKANIESLNDFDFDDL